MHRPLRPLAALAMLALLSAGCSNAPADGSGNNSVVTQSLSSSSTPAGANTGRSSDTTTAVTSTRPTVTPTVVPSAGSVGGSNAANRDQALKFAQCMRANGVKQFPDPDAAGQLTIDAIANGSSLDTNSAAFKQAISACRNLEPPGFTGGTRSPEQQQAALKFAQCIRDNGVKDFPDPAPDAPLVDTNRIPSTAKTGGMSVLHAAMQTCRGLAASAGVTGDQ